MGMNEATDYIPTKPTYALRIFSSFVPNMVDDFPLTDSRNYTAIKAYIFDDNDSSYEAGPAWINPRIARDMIIDFQTHKKDIETLLIHCTHGKNRSPAIAMAFNDIFGFGYSILKLMEKYAAFNKHTYKTLLDTARGLGLIK